MEVESMAKNPEKIAIYSRKSRFTGKGESIGNQVELCRAYVISHYGEDAANKIVVYEDEGFSGGNLNRPDFQKMMAEARKHQFQAIIVYRLDRISRNISDFSGLIEELARLDIAFVSIKEQFDTGTPMGRAMMYIASVFSQLERETIAERIRDNMRELAKTGRWLGGTTPTGFASESVKNITIDGKAKKMCRLKQIPEEAEVVRTIYALYEEYDSLTMTEAALMKRGIKTKTGRYFTRFSIKNILQNPVYMTADPDAYAYFIKAEAELFSNKEAFDGIHGIMAYNRTNQVRGKTTEFLPPMEWIVSVGQHPGMISGKTWVSIQESLERNKTKSYHRPQSNEALLTGVLFCSCGSRMYPKLGRKKLDDGTTTYMYVCKRKERSQKSLCSRNNANGFELDQAVMEKIRQLKEDPHAFFKQVEQIRNGYKGKNLDREKQIHDLKKEKNELATKIEGLVDSLAELGDGAARKRVAERIEQLSRERESIVMRMQNFENEHFDHILCNSELEQTAKHVFSFSNCVDEMTLEQKRFAVRTVIQKVVWDGVEAHVMLFGSGD